MKSMRTRNMTYDNGPQRNKFDDLNLVRLSVSYQSPVAYTHNKETSSGIQSYGIRYCIAWYKLTYVPKVPAASVFTLLH